MPVGSHGLTEVLKGFGWAYKSGERTSNGDGGGRVQRVHKKFQNKLVTSKLRPTGRWTCKQWGLGGERERLQSGWLTTGLLNYIFVFL